MKDKNIHFIINPISGKGIGHKVISKIKEYFVGWNYKIKTTRGKYDGYNYALQSIEEGAELIVSCGGDGTLNEIASAMVNKQVPLAIVPIGSGNGLARHLQIPLHYKEALQVIKTAKQIVYKIDCGKINDNYFFSNAGIGYDAEVIQVYSRQKQRQLLGYIKSMLISIFKFEPVQMSLQSKQKNYTGKIMLANISNSNCIGYGFSTAPKASLHDGKLDINLIPKCSWITFSWIGLGFLFQKNLGKKRKIFFKTDEIKIKISADYVQLDGEFTPLNSDVLHISIVPNALLILVN